MTLVDSAPLNVTSGVFIKMIGDWKVYIRTRTHLITPPVSSGAFLNFLAEAQISFITPTGQSLIEGGRDPFTTWWPTEECGYATEKIGLVFLRDAVFAKLSVGVVNVMMTALREYVGNGWVREDGLRELKMSVYDRRGGDDIYSYAGLILDTSSMIRPA